VVAVSIVLINGAEGVSMVTVARDTEINVADVVQ
jgi:hypothetical protein